MIESFLFADDPIKTQILDGSGVSVDITDMTAVKVTKLGVTSGQPAIIEVFGHGGLETVLEFNDGQWLLLSDGSFLEV